MDQLEKLQKHLALCDDVIMDALMMRNAIVEHITEYKYTNDMRIVQSGQEDKRRKTLRKKMQGKPHCDEVLDVFETIFYNSKKVQSQKLFDFNIVLIGFMGCGKSSISRTLRKLFAMEVIEMDQVIEEREGMTINEIFQMHGEEYFRNAETALLVELQGRKNVVISCGGGTPLREVNVAEMKKNGKVILLTAKPETIFERVKNNHDRPLLENNKNVAFIADLMEKRREKYEAAADITIHTDGKNTFEICEEIIDRLRENQ